MTCCAAASVEDSMLVSFNVPVTQSVRHQADHLGVQLVEAGVVYRVLDEMKERLESMLDPLEVVDVQGTAEILQCFPIDLRTSDVLVAGCRVKNGVIRASDTVQVLRNNDSIFKGIIDELRREKMQAKEVSTGMECGLLLRHKRGGRFYDGFQPGDIVQGIKVRYEKKKIEGTKRKD